MESSLRRVATRRHAMLRPTMQRSALQRIATLRFSALRCSPHYDATPRIAVPRGSSHCGASHCIEPLRNALRRDFYAMTRKPPTVVSSRRDAGGRARNNASATVQGTSAVGHKLPGAERRTLAQLPSQPRSASPANPQREDVSVPLARVGRSPGRPALSRLEQDYELTFGVLFGLAALAVLLHLLEVGR